MAACAGTVSAVRAVPAGTLRTDVADSDVCDADATIDDGTADAHGIPGAAHAVGTTADDGILAAAADGTAAANLADGTAAAAPIPVAKLVDPASATLLKRLKHI